jgi:hypothetical protein
MNPKTITFQPPRSKDLRVLAKELGFLTTTELIMTALREYLFKRDILL